MLEGVILLAYLTKTDLFCIWLVYWILIPCIILPSSDRRVRLGSITGSRISSPRISYYRSLSFIFSVTVALLLLTVTFFYNTAYRN